jgi:hypothetical protein
VIGLAVMGTWYRPLLFASIDPETAEARGVPVRGLGLMFLLARALTGAAQVVGTLLVLSLAITPGAAQRLSASPLVSAGCPSVSPSPRPTAGLLVSFEISTVKASVFITGISFAIYLLAASPAPRCGTADATAPAGKAVPAAEPDEARHGQGWLLPHGTMQTRSDRERPSAHSQIEAVAIGTRTGYMPRLRDDPEAT